MNNLELVTQDSIYRAVCDDRVRLDFSNYGSRVDVQGWGRMVATLEYGDLQSCTGAEADYTDRHYTGEFAGTSSASPIVAVESAPALA